MDPARAAQKFYFALQKVPDWQSLPVTVAGQAVQISAFPDAYADDVPLAKALLDDPGMANAADVSSQVNVRRVRRLPRGSGGTRHGVVSPAG